MVADPGTMNAFTTLIGLLSLLLLALGCTAVVLVAIILSLMPPELEDRHERRSGQSAERGLRRGGQGLWQRENQTAQSGPSLRALQPVPSSRVHSRARPR
jgi:hypothetical protein